ncbi:MAG: hypothetical protein ACYCSW_04370 [bacterium]
MKNFKSSPVRCHSCESRKVPKVETHAVSVHEAISRERSGYPALLMHCSIFNNLYRQFWDIFNTVI